MSIEELVAEDIARRARKGLAKYGFSVGENPLPLKEWLQHAYEESLDLPIYLKRAIIELQIQNEKLKIGVGEPRASSASQSGVVPPQSKVPADYSDPCGCIKCLRERKENLHGIPIERTRMVCCPICGNKRCPHASDHAFKCTNSNDPDQPGSIFQSK